MTTVKEYRDKTHKVISKLFDNIEDAKQQVDNVSDSEKKKFNERLEMLEDKKQALTAEYQRLSNLSGQAKDDALIGFEAARDELDKAWKRVKLDFKLS